MKVKLILENTEGMTSLIKIIIRQKLDEVKGHLCLDESNLAHYGTMPAAGD